MEGEMSPIVETIIIIIIIIILIIEVGAAV